MYVDNGIRDFAKMLSPGPPGYALLFAGVGRQFGTYMCVHIPHASAIRHVFSTSGID